MIGLSQAVTLPSAVSVVSDGASDVGSTLISNWVLGHPEWAFVAMIAFFFLAAILDYLRKQAKRTDTQLDDVLVDAASKTVDKTKAKLKKDG